MIKTQLNQLEQMGERTGGCRIGEGFWEGFADLVVGTRLITVLASSASHLLLGFILETDVSER